MKTLMSLSFFLLLALALHAEVQIEGRVLDQESGQPLIGATIQAMEPEGATQVTDTAGRFSIPVRKLPVRLSISFIGYETKEVEVISENDQVEVWLNWEVITIGRVVVRGKTLKEDPASSWNLGYQATLQAPTPSIYDATQNLPEVDLLTGSLAFKVINTRGFATMAPVRSVQLVDGMDNQSPGLNFSLGNFLTVSELDIQQLEVVAGANSPLYGPNAFNGVVKINTRSPFYHTGLSAMVKLGERNWREGALRWAQKFTNPEGEPWLAWKMNVSLLTAEDWQADNYDPVTDSRVPADHPGRYDAVNIYGDEYTNVMDFSNNAPWDAPGLGSFYRSGYREVDLVDYDTRNLKAGLALHLRLQPGQRERSPELILASNYGGGATVFQGENRFSLRDVHFLQTRLELRKPDRYTFRLYQTTEDGGNSYDPFATALELQQQRKTDRQWSSDYRSFWILQIQPRVYALGYPQFCFTCDPMFDFAGAESWLQEYRDSLTQWHLLAEQAANEDSPVNDGLSYYAPGTPEFQEAFDRLTGTLNTGPGTGTRLFDRSSLYHFDGEYFLRPAFLEYLLLGMDARLYTPNTRGTILGDAEERFTNYQYGFYLGAKKVLDEKWTLNLTLRADKNENFDWVASPAFSVLWKPSPRHLLRAGFSSALRYPTLINQYQNQNVGPAILRGNLSGADSLITIESFDTAVNQIPLPRWSLLEYYSIDPLRPEQVRTLEFGYRADLDRLGLDLNYYHSFYRDFIGFDIGLQVAFQQGFPQTIQVLRHSVNSKETVRTQGAGLALEYRWTDYLFFRGNYSWNQLITRTDDPVIPAFNTPEHKYNLTIEGRAIPLSEQLDGYFQISYRWVDGFIFEGSPQFTGAIPAYDLLDAQVSIHLKDWNTRIKLGASNLLNDRQFQVYGGPRVGRLAYLSIQYR